MASAAAAGVGGTVKKLEAGRVAWEGLLGDGVAEVHAEPEGPCGGVCVLDEGNRMNEKSWASLAPLLDHRRYVESIVAGVTIPAHRDFRCAVTMNQDDSTYEIPDYILSRLQPTLQVGFPNRRDELAILQYHLPFAEPQMLSLTIEMRCALAGAAAATKSIAPASAAPSVRAHTPKLVEKRDIRR